MSIAPAPPSDSQGASSCPEPTTDSAPHTEQHCPADEACTAAESEPPLPETAEGPWRLPSPLMLDRHIQTILATRAVLYVLGCVGYFAVVLFCTRWMYAPQQSLTEHLREYLLATLEWLPAVMLLIPLVVLDMLLLSRRVVAPLQEIERSLDAIAQGQQPPQPESDDDAFHHGLVSSYQRCVARLRENAGAPPQQAADESAPPGADSAPVPEAGEEVEPEQLLDTTPQLAASS